MKELLKWLKENVGDNITIITPQFDRNEQLEYDYKPETKAEFMAIVEKAPLNILQGLGFRKWDTMNNCIKDNQKMPVSNKIEFPIINSKSKEVYVTDIGRKNAPIKLLAIDEDIILFPAEWYSIIPDGFIVTGLNGEQYPFKNGYIDDDTRFGCLAYGIRRPI